MRGVGRARTPNHVRRSSAPSRRPYFARASMLARMLVLDATRTTSLILAQRTYGAANAMTLLSVLADVWRAKDVGETDPPTPMGTGPLSVRRGRRPRKERIEAVHASSFTQLRAARMRKTLLLLVCVY